MAWHSSAFKNYLNELYDNAIFTTRKGPAMSGGVTVEGNDWRDVRQKMALGRDPDQPRWIEIEPAFFDFGRETKIGFRVRYCGETQTFTKEVSSAEELFQLIRPIVKERDAHARARVREKEKERKRELAKAVKDAAIALKAAKEKAKA